MNSPDPADPAEPRRASASARFLDPRSPHQMRCALERRHLVPFTPATREGRLEFRAEARHNGLPCAFRLAFEEALAAGNLYTLDMELSWEHLPAEHDAYYRGNSRSWFDLWRQGLEPAPDPAPGAGSPVRYQEQVAEAFEAEADLPDAPSLQREILLALRRGATYATAHKEGGSTLGWNGEAFFRDDFGEQPAREVFPDEAAFLAHLRRFFDRDVTRNAPPPGPVTEETAWRLILRLLQPS